MHLYILSRGRAHQQRTLQSLPTKLLSDVTIVVPQAEASAYRKMWPSVRVKTQPESIRRIAEKRAWVTRTHFHNGRREPMLLLDDDLHLYEWDGQRHVTPQRDSASWLRLWRAGMAKLFVDYAAVSLGTKAFALPGTIRQNYHMGYVFGFTYDAYNAIVWNRVNFYEDIDYTLQLLRKGHRIGVTYEITVQQHKANAPGGCSDERSQEAMDADLETLIKLHPGIIRRKQATATHPQANTRISWRGAAKEGGLI